MPGFLTLLLDSWLVALYLRSRVVFWDCGRKWFTGMMFFFCVRYLLFKYALEISDAYTYVECETDVIQMRF